MSGPLDVVYFDDNSSQLASFGRVLNSVFKEIHPDIDVEQFELIQTPSRDANLDKIEQELIRRRPHVIIFDNFIWKEYLGTGQKIIARLKPKLPDSVFCLLTKESLKSDNFGLHFPNPDIVISKLYLKAGIDENGENPYKLYLRKLISEKVNRARKFPIIWNESFDKIFNSLKCDKGKKARVEEIVSIIEQVLYDGTITCASEKISLTSINGGRSGSIVLGCKIIGSVRYAITGVIKISKVNQAREELANYNKYVKWLLPYTWRIDVIGTGFSENFGGICYSFAFEGQGLESPKSASEFINNSQFGVIDKICSSIFDPSKKTWYAQIGACETEISEYFTSHKYYKKPSLIEDRVNQLYRLLSENFENNFIFSENHIVLYGKKVERPDKLILAKDWGKIEECISHGDLHCGNILVHPGSGDVAFIDFQHTGYHYLFRDFVSVESSIRIEWPSVIMINDVTELLDQEILLSTFDANAPLEPYLQYCYKIRKVALINFPENSTNSRRSMYLIGLYTQYLWLVTRFDHWNKSSKIRLLLGAFASLMGLQILRDEHHNHNSTFK
ncbi:phosphotransferase [Plasticicumulans sp.]|uniref:phosphotransferase n=1 Tax=Plasticicumulans sp. TaxID=2307179 RepID=UPI003961AE63